MKKLVIMPGGFHPWHAGHTALYHAAKAAFPSADVFVAATADTTTRPFPFKIKKLLAQYAGVPQNRFIQVKSPFSAAEITQLYDPETTQLIFVRSEKDRDSNPKPGGTKKDGSPSYLQPYARTGLLPMAKHAYMHYLPVAQFASGMTSATEIRSKWPEMSPEQKQGLVKSIYPAVATNSSAVAKLIEILDSVMDSSAVGEVVEFVSSDEQVHEGTISPNSAVADVITCLRDALTYIKQQDFDKVKDILTGNELLFALDQLTDDNFSQYLDGDEDHNAELSALDPDYAEEK